jgi:hypothetical protein
MPWLLILINISLNAPVTFDVIEQPVYGQVMVPGVEVAAERLTQAEIDTLYILPMMVVTAERIKTTGGSGLVNQYDRYRKAVVSTFSRISVVGGLLIFGLLFSVLVTMIVNRLSAIPHWHKPKPDPRQVYIHALARRVKNRRL